MYLIVITRKRNVGSLLGHAVWKAVDFDVISYQKTVLHLSEIQVSTSPLKTTTPAAHATVQTEASAQRSQEKHAMYLMMGLVMCC